jgi:prepilin-type N-terminal cleavage/methylation domain-containing protein
MKQGFTLIELLVVITIIGILAGLTLGAGGALRDKAARSRAAAELAAFDTALERYRVDNGDYPDARCVTVSGDLYGSDTFGYPGEAATVSGRSANVNGSVKGDAAGSGGRFLFACLMGRRFYHQDGQPVAYPQYYEPKSSQVKTDGSGDYFKDPYNNAYGYYYDAANQTRVSGNDQKSLFNMVEPDIWSTGGQLSTAIPSTDENNARGYAVYLKWIKNWASQ